MNDFTSFLKTKCRIPEKKIRFYLYWVVQYNEFASNCEQADTSGIGTFLEKLSCRREDWQVLQAEKAVSLYEYYMKSLPILKSARIDRASAEKLTDWQCADDELVRQLRLRHRSFSTEKTYRGWLRRFAAYLCKGRKEVSQADLKSYLSYLAVESRVSAATQNQAFNALLFAFRYVFDQPVEGLEGTIRSRVRRRLPIVLSQREVALVLSSLSARHKLMASLIYGGGLRLRECLMLRQGDIDFDRYCITVRSGKGDKDRQTILPQKLVNELKGHVTQVRKIFERDGRNRVAGVRLPNALDRKYPHAGKEWTWFWVFPSYKLSVDPVSGITRRHHIYPTTLQKAFKQAVRRAGITKRATVHCMRHSFATHLVESGYDIRTVQELLGHASVQTTMIYTHVAKKNTLGVRSPLETI